MLVENFVCFKKWPFRIKVVQINRVTSIKIWVCWHIVTRYLIWILKMTERLQITTEIGETPYIFLFLNPFHPEESYKTSPYQIYMCLFWHRSETRLRLATTCEMQFNDNPLANMGEIKYRSLWKSTSPTSSGP